MCSRGIHVVTEIDNAMRRQSSLAPDPAQETIAAYSLIEWMRAGALLFVSTVAVAVLCWSVIGKLVHAWAQSRTYAHGFLMFPAALYMMWEYRERWIGLVPRRSYRGFLVGAMLLLMWSIGRSTEADLFQQAALLAMFPALVLACYGAEVFRAVQFPLGALVFGLPVGSELEPALQSFTAGFIAVVLHITTIPFQQDGYFITLSSSIWEVAPDCGGLRYILPGLACGYVFTGFVHSRTAQRVCYLFLCAVTLSIANGLRAAAIVLGDHSGISNGADHRVFSYVVYGATAIFLGWLGLSWRRDDLCDGTVKTELILPERAYGTELQRH